MNFKEFQSLYEEEEVIRFANYENNKEPLVSVCVHTFQHSTYIAKCLDSILSQKTNFKFEVLLGEDDSIDGTRQICLNYAKSHPDIIRLFLHNRKNNITLNGHPSGRFNFMYNLYNARGKIIALCEGDDYWTDPKKLQKQVDYLNDNPDVNLTGHYAQIKDFSGLTNKIVGKHSDDLFNHDDINYRNLRIPTASLVFRNNLKYPEWITKVYGGDRAIIFLNSQKGKLKILNFVGSVYNIHSQGIEQSFKKDKVQFAFRNIHEDYIYYNEVRNKISRQRIKKKILWNLSYASFFELKSLNLKEFTRITYSAIIFSLTGHLKINWR